MIGFIIDQIIGPFWPYLAGAGALVVAWLTGRSSGASKQKAKQAKEALNATVKGNEAARQGKAAAAEKLRQGQTPEQIVRSNDDAWQ